MGDMGPMRNCLLCTYHPWMVVCRWVLVHSGQNLQPMSYIYLNHEITTSLHKGRDTNIKVPTLTFPPRSSSQWRHRIPGLGLVYLRLLQFCLILLLSGSIIFLNFLFSAVVHKISNPKPFHQTRRISTISL